MLAIALALAASACYGVANFIGPVLSRSVPVMPVLVVGQAVAFAVSAAVVAAGADAVPTGAPLAGGLLAGVGNAVGLVAYYRAADFGPLSIVAPIGSLAAALPVVVGLASGDELGVAQAAGIPLAIAGVALASRRQSDPLVEQPAKRDLPRAVAYSLLGAAGFGLFLAGMGTASDGGVFSAVATSRASLLVVLVTVAVTLRRTLRAPPAELPKLALPGVLLFLGTLSYTAATREGLLSVVSVLGSLFPVVTVALALIILRERLGPAQRVGVVATLAGVLLISAQA